MDPSPLSSPRYCRHTTCIYILAGSGARRHRSGPNSSGEPYTGIAGEKYEPDERAGSSAAACAARVDRTVKMLEFTGYICLSFRSCPLRVLLVAANPFECPTRISPFHVNRDSRIYQFICCTWSAARRPIERDAKSVSHRARVKKEKYNYRPLRLLTTVHLRELV